VPLIRSKSDGEILTIYFTEAKFLDELVIRQAQDEVLRVLEKTHEPSVVFDFRFVKFLSSSAFGMLIRVQKKSKDFKIALKLCNIDPEILKVFKITGLDKVFSIYPGDLPEETGVFAKLKPRPSGGAALRAFDPEEIE
jgi:anti-anti-sigma factor